MYVLPLAASNGWSCSYSYVYIIFSYCHLRFYHGEDSLMYFSLHYYAAQIKLLHIHFLYISLHLHKVTLHNIMLHNCIQDRGHTEVTLLFFQESLRESCSKVEELQQKEREREIERESEREREVAREREREKEREREQDLQHSSEALKELETKVRILEQLESQVQVLVERGLVRLERTPSGQVDLQVVPVNPLVSPTGQTSVVSNAA